ncbi:solute carrier family 25 member 44-like isoform X1 [Mya arenaria]|uniref:solute carrier family 25 member 44-like isoform X1 n=1 Tax=Mya arenaria TaxID=6604 RepID=UPI0022E4AB20|nr:solute carrier family 25 member 44-like isoform X1 [Mya arenaria]
MDELLGEEIHVIELHMMDLRKFFPLTAASNAAARTFLYPLHLVRTHLQTQVGKQAYKGTWDAIKSIHGQQGISGLYRGLPVHLCQVLPGMGYIYTYEYVRNVIRNHTNWSDGTKSLIGGGTASVVAQIFNVPIDIVSQHMMLIDGRKKSSKNVTVKTNAQKSLQQINITEEMKQRRFGVFQGVVRHVYHNDGILGFYRGMSMSLLLFIPNSALFWYFYEHLKGKMVSVLPENVPRMLINCLASPLAGMSAAAIMNPVDVVRVRMQTKNVALRNTVETLIQEEGFFWLFKGLTARFFHSALGSTILILGYEAVKRGSLKSKYQDQVRW